jgi:hypothetical protein
LAQEHLQQQMLAAQAQAARLAQFFPGGLPMLTRTFSTTWSTAVSLALGPSQSRARARRCCQMISSTSPPS